MKIGIFTAMEKEAKSFLQNATKTMEGAFAVYQLKLGKHDAVLICPPNIGEIGASSACQILISKYHVDMILNFGVVGALTHEMETQKFLYVGSVVHYDFDSSAIDPIPPARYQCFDDVALTTDADLISKAMSLQQLPIVRCASADKFVDDGNAKIALNKNYGADICDMESAGILITCKFNNIPCLLVKCVSDSIFGGAKDYWENVYTVTNDFFDFACQLVEKL